MKKLIKFVSFASLALVVSLMGFLKKDPEEASGTVTLGDVLPAEKAHADVPHDGDDDCDEDEDEDEDC